MRVLDLSHRLDGQTPVYPGDARPSLTLDKTFERDGYTAHLLRTGLHAGTHADMPSHMTADRRQVCDFDPSLFIGEGLLLDVRGQDPITMKEGYRALPLRGRIVLLYTGFSERYGEPDYFTARPVVGERLARFLVAGGIKMLGLDTPSPDYPPFPVHKLLLDSNVFILENLTNLEALAGLPAFTVAALPIKIAAEASPVRAVALAAPI